MRGGAAVAALCATVLVASCGIPEYVFLAPPVLRDVTSLPPVVTFAHDTVNDTDSFLGYELFYKFYDPAITDAPAALSADRTAIESAPPGSVTTTLASRGYRRVYTSSVQSRPALQVAAAERDQPFTVTLAFPDTPASTDPAVASWDPGTPALVALLRDQAALASIAGGPYGFAPGEISGAHPDTPTLAVGPGTVEMGLAVASYGTDYLTGSFAEIYSTAIVADQLLQVAYQ